MEIRCILLTVCLVTGIIADTVYEDVDEIRDVDMVEQRNSRISTLRSEYELITLICIYYFIRGVEFRSLVVMSCSIFLSMFNITFNTYLYFR